MVALMNKQMVWIVQAPDERDASLNLLAAVAWFPDSSTAVLYVIYTYTHKRQTQQNYTITEWKLKFLWNLKLELRLNLFE